LKRKNLYLKWKDKNQIVEILNNGGVGVVPTETVFGIIGKPDKTKRINEIKKSPENKPLTFFIGNHKQVNTLWDPIPKPFSQAIQHWPGPFTLLAGSPLVGIRMPDVEELCEIINETSPLASTSANLSGEDTSTTIEGMSEAFLEEVDFIIDESIENQSNRASTILKIEDNRVSIIREGFLTMEDLNIKQ